MTDTALFLGVPPKMYLFACEYGPWLTALYTLNFTQSMERETQGKDYLNSTFHIKKALSKKYRKKFIKHKTKCYNNSKRVNHFKLV